MSYKQAQNNAVSDETVQLLTERINKQFLDGIVWTATHDKDLKMSKDNMCAKVIVNGKPQRAAWGVDVIFNINEDVFDSLSDASQIIVLDKLVAGISYDPDKEIVKRNTPDIQEHSGILLKYPFPTLQATSIEIAQIYEKLKEDKTDSNGNEVDVLETEE